MVPLVWCQLGRQALFRPSQFHRILANNARNNTLLSSSSADSMNQLRLASTKSIAEETGAKTTKSSSKISEAEKGKKPKATKRTTNKQKAKPASKATAKNRPSFKSERLYSPPPVPPPRHAGQIFLTQYLAKIPRPFEFAKTMSEIWAAWHQLSETERSVYKAQREEIIAKYKVDLDAWDKSLTPEARTQYMRDIRLRKAQAKQRNPVGNLKKPPPPFFLFSIEMGETKKLPFASPRKVEGRERATKLKEIWGNMTLGEKAPYVAKWQQLAKDHQTEKARLLQEHLVSRQSQKSSQEATASAHLT